MQPICFRNSILAAAIFIALMIGSTQPVQAQNGACCSELGCIDLTQVACDNFEGVWLGLGTACDNGDCDYGACCLAGGNCQDRLRAQCNALSGTFHVDEPCFTNPCGAGGGMGACCTDAEPGAGCTQATQENCEAGGRVFIGVGIACEPNPCGGELPVAACCTEEGCSELTEADCSAAGGSWIASVNFCSPFTCVASACCLNDGIGTCVDLIPSQCNAAGGEYYTAIACAESPCPVVEAGACCLDLVPNAPCFVMSRFDCESNGRHFIGDGIPCTPNPCARCITCAGDADNNGSINGADVRSYVDCVIAANGGAPTPGCECADMNGNGAVTSDEIAAFAETLIEQTGPCE